MMDRIIIKGEIVFTLGDGRIRIQSIVLQTKGHRVIEKVSAKV